MKTLLTLLATAVMVNLAIAQGTQVSAKTGPELLVLKETSFRFQQNTAGTPGYPRVCGKQPVCNGYPENRKCAGQLRLYNPCVETRPRSPQRSH